MPLTALIAEDEPLLAQALRAELLELWPELTVLPIAPNGPAALQSLLAERPTLAFLDIRMPGLTGIEVAEALAEEWPPELAPPLLVFVTAYDQYALQAFEHAAVDYVLKPVRRERLAQTVQRLHDRLQQRKLPEQIEASEQHAPPVGVDVQAEWERLSAQVRQLIGLRTGRVDAGPAAGASAVDPGTGSAPGESREPLRMIRAGVGDTVRLIGLDQIIYFQATDKYVNVVTADGEALIRESLRELLPRLDPRHFVQIHRGTVVAIDRVQAAMRDERGRTVLQLKDRAERLVVSRLHAHLFKAM